MDNNTKVAFPSIFDTAVESEKEFDNMFGGEEDCDLMDAVCGFKEDGSVLPDAAELHQTDDEATPKDIKDELGEDHDTKNAPDCDSSEADVLNDEEGNNISCAKCGVQDSVKGDATKIDDENIEDEADKAAETFDEAYYALMREADEDMGVEPEVVPPGEATPPVETPDATAGGKKCDDCDDCEDKDDDDDDKDDEEDLVSDLSDDDDDDDSDDDDDDVEEAAEEEFDNSDIPGDAPDDEAVQEDALPADADEEDLINAVEDESKSDEPSVDELEKELDTDEDEDLIDIVAGTSDAE